MKHKSKGIYKKNNGFLRVILPIMTASALFISFFTIVRPDISEIVKVDVLERSSFTIEEVEDFNESYFSVLYNRVLKDKKVIYKYNVLRDDAKEVSVYSYDKIAIMDSAGLIKYSNGDVGLSKWSSRLERQQNK